MLSLPPLPPGVRLLTDEEVRRLSLISEAPPPPEQCITCLGTGTFRWWSYADPSQATVEPYVDAFKCPCVDQWQINRYLLNANVLKAYQQLSWRDATHVDPAAAEAVMDYTEHAEAYLQAGLGLILHGSTNGTGKTLLATLLAKGLLARGVDCYFITFSDLIDRLADGWKDLDAQQWFQRRVKNVSVLVIDDIGKEYQGKKQSGLPQSAFDSVLRHRVASALPTLLTTNLDLGGLHRDYNTAVMSLLSERCKAQEVVGTDFRKRSNDRLVDEAVRLGLTRPRVFG